ncbi:uncharacterized protein LOC107262362 [Ricinus communis]|uniref:uncharacterized protein LOC107262362 n=1 Tax=Ricinus communis TaxID=3988 RepID=UPI0007721E4D|nr:uncharacterized protein LOC107262362 [Ricinus communis]|eukprot:XP_015583226.1 uncharacterized protein LOC107262362 [Ricinus communis]
MTESSSSNKFVQPTIPKFDGFYEHWAKLMENFLQSKEMWNLVEDGVVASPQNREPTDEETKAITKQQLKDKKVKNYLYQAIDREIMETILNDDTLKQIWDSMKQKFKGLTRVKRAQLQTLKIEFEFNYIVCSIEESNNVETLTIDELQSSLLIHEQRMKGSNEEEQALKVTHEERYERGRGRGTMRSRGRGKGKQFTSRAAVECYRCYNLGHYQYECPNWEKRANYAKFNEEEEMLLMAQLDEGFRHSVKLGNNSKLEVMRKGNIRLEFGGITQIGLHNGKLDDPNRMFLVITNIIISTPTYFNANGDDLGEIWHKRFGHLSYIGAATQ